MSRKELHLQLLLRAGVKQEVALEDSRRSRTSPAGFGTCFRAGRSGGKKGDLKFNIQEQMETKSEELVENMMNVNLILWSFFI